jgi:hypothetical protein
MARRVRAPVNDSRKLTIGGQTRIVGEQTIGSSPHCGANSTSRERLDLRPAG